MNCSRTRWPVIAGCCWAFFGSVVSASALQIHELVVVSSADMMPAAGLPEEAPLGQEAAGQESLLPEEGEVVDSSELFGLRGGYFHPYLSVGGEYTDNLFNLDDDEVANMLWRISPGIWFSLPRTKEIPVEVTPHNTSPGGLQLQLDDYQGTDRYQAYALAGADFLTYSENSDFNDTNLRLEGLFRYNMRGGLSLQVLDRFTDGEDHFEFGGETRDYLVRYISNLFIGTVDYQMTEKLRAKFDYSHFLLDYDEAVNDFLDRTDNLFDFYGYYDYSPKTSLFVQYRYADVTYDTAIQKDNSQHYLYGGMTWDTTEKLSLLLKAGYQFRDYEDTLFADAYDWDGFIVNLQSLYRWTEKTEFTLDFYRKSEESDSAVAIDKVVFGSSFTYRQRFTEKLTGLFNLMYENAEYTQLVASARDDDRFSLRPALRHLFREWLMFELAYSYDTRDSSDDDFDYTTNTLFFSINFAL